MNENKESAIKRMNEMGAKGKPFVFLIDFDFQKPLILDIEDTSHLLWEIPGNKNYQAKEFLLHTVDWTIEPVKYEEYKHAFSIVQQHIQLGDTYLLNLTMPTEVNTNSNLEQLFYKSKAPYKLWLKDQFVCFSPEIFIKIKEGIISSYPMKGTIDASIENAEFQFLNDEK